MLYLNNRENRPADQLPGGFYVMPLCDMLPDGFAVMPLCDMLPGGFAVMPLCGMLPDGFVVMPLCRYVALPGRSEFCSFMLDLEKIPYYTHERIHL